jgi:hypothetical protein
MNIGNSKTSFVISRSGNISAFVGDKTYITYTTDPNYDRVLRCYNNNDHLGLIESMGIDPNIRFAIMVPTPTPLQLPTP